MLHKSGMWAKIKEYSFKWSTDRSNVSILFIGLKFLFFRRPIDNNVNKRLNFMPLYSDEMDYVINGT